MKNVRKQPRVRKLKRRATLYELAKNKQNLIRRYEKTKIEKM